MMFTRVVLIFLLPIQLLAAPQPISSPLPEGVRRQKTLNFDGEWIEAVNKQPLDSLMQTGQNEKRNSAHLYKKKSDFSGEIANGLNQLRFIQP